MRGILFIRELRGNLIGGVELKVLCIAENLYQMGLFAPVLVTSDSESVFAERFRELGFPVYAIPMRGFGNIRKSVKRIEPILKRHDIALVQSHMFRESIIGRKIRKAHPELFHIFRVHVYMAFGKIPGWRRFLYYCLDNRTARNVDAFVSISSTVKKELIEKSRIHPECVFVVPNGIAPMGPPDPKNTSEAPLKAAVAIIGDLQERKQQHLAAKIIGLLHKKGLDINLHLIGKDRNNYGSQIRAVAKAQDVDHLVHFYGYQCQDNIPKILRDVAVIMLPSLSEGIPTSIMEGMSVRKLVVASFVGGTNELVENGINGFLHTPGSVEELVTILEKIFTLPAKTWEPVRDAAYATWREKFTIEKMIDSLTEIYQKLGILE